MAQSTIKTYLCQKNSTAYTPLVDIKTFPDMGAAPQTIEVTTMSDDVQKFINGVGTNAAMEFTANYDTEAYDNLLDLKDKKDEEFYLCFGGYQNPTSVFKWTGELSVWVIGGGVNGVVEMKISIAPSSAITLVE